MINNFKLIKSLFVILFNKAYHLDNWDDYNLDYQFYITEANKLKNPLIMKELDLFV